MEIYLLMMATLGVFTRFFWIGQVEGRHNIPRKGGVIIASNHQSWLDFCFLATVVRRRLYFLVGEFAYKYFFTKSALNRMGHIKVDRNQHDQKFVYDEAKKILDAGKALVMFPEGKMTRTGKLQPAYKGVAKMALASKVDIIPTVIESYHIYPAHKKWPKFRERCRIKFLEPIQYSRIKNMDPEHIVHNIIMPEIAKELGHEYPHPGVIPKTKKLQSSKSRKATSRKKAPAVV